MARAVLEDAMAVKFQLDVADQLVIKGRRVLEKGYAKVADKEYELSRFKEPLDRIHNATMVVQEAPTDGPIAECMKFCNMANLTGQSQSLLPFYNEASDDSALQYDCVGHLLRIHLEAIDDQTLARSKFHAVIRELNAFPTIQVATVEEAQFVKDFTSSNVTYSPVLTPEGILKIRAAVQGIEGIEAAAPGGN